MHPTQLNPLQALNKAYRKVKSTRAKIEAFKINLINLIDKINEAESEEFHKNLVADFFKQTYYGNDYFINTKERSDLVIHSGKNAHTPVNVIIETKRPSNRAEMTSVQHLNTKALQELVLYYLRERITLKNLEVKYLITTNIYEWFIFDAADFENIFAQNRKLVEQFKAFELGHLAGTKTAFFYQELAKPVISAAINEISYTHFDIRDYEQPLSNANQRYEHKLIALYKLLSPEHLLKLPFANDSNSLDKFFYTELLHIIGLTEIKEKSKKLIQRHPTGKRNSGSLLENAITQLDSLDKISRLSNPQNFGATQDEQLFNVGLELVITWINRILFLKLLEAQLINYHQGDKSYSFLNLDMVANFDDLNSLFFSVLARKPLERNDDVRTIFAKVPYLNSSLFEPTEIEHNTIVISNLRDERTLPILTSTVLKTRQGKKRSGELNALAYLFEFLNAYEFGNEGSEAIQEDNKALINASVLGLIFEKINGYKDGSFFTPGFITMYMCRETIRRTVVQKFNDTKAWNCKTIDQLYDRIDDKSEANDIINSLKICDPAVGSGHFLVSALNELIAIKSDLKILLDRNGKTLRDYQLEVVNDDLIITDDDGSLFVYNPKLPESRRIQETLFHEKQTIIENCLFGVDINNNSVKICRLRLWIELLKNAYYTPASNYTELETLPNIDINIKCGNSLISRYTLDADIKQALRKSKWTIDSYRLAVMSYRNAEDKEHKRAMESLINSIKHDFESEINHTDKRIAKLDKLKNQLTALINQPDFFEIPKTKKAQLKKETAKVTKAINKLEADIADIKNNKIYENAFEWRFEFPEVLNDDGDFIGFDVIIGNPPYIYRNTDIASFKDYFNSNYFNCSGNYDLYKFFIELSIRLNRKNGYSSLITNSSFLLQTSFKKTRQFILENTYIISLIPLGGNIFEEAMVDSAIYVLQKSKSLMLTNIVIPQEPKLVAQATPYLINSERFYSNEFLVFDYLLNSEEYDIVNRLFTSFPKIEDCYELGVGINTGYIKSELTSYSKIDETYHPMVPGTGISTYGNVNTDGFIMYDKNFVRNKGTLGRTLPDEKFFTQPKILVVRTRNISLKKRIISTIDYDKKYNLNRISNIIAKPNNSLEGLLAVLNSTLFNWLYSKRFYDYEIKPIYLRNSPLCNTNNTKLGLLAKQALEIQSKDANADIKEILLKIDHLVYKLYDLTEAEIAIIEGK